MKSFGTEIKRNNLRQSDQTLRLRAKMLIPNMNNYLSIFAVKFAGVIVTLILNVVLARHLGAEQFGSIPKLYQLS